MILMNKRIYEQWAVSFLCAAGCFALAGCVTGSAKTSSIMLSDTGIVEERITLSTSELHSFPNGEGLVAGRTAPSGVDTVSDSAANFGGTYRIGAGDTLYLRSFDDESLSGEVAVRYDGYVSLPLIPDIYVEGATRSEATERIREAYATIFSNPLISVSISDVGSKSYFVMGDVSDPGEFSYLRPVDLLDAINLAGGPRINTLGGDSFVGAQGQILQVFVIRTVDGERRVMNYNLGNLTKPGPHDSEARVYPNDVVYVPEGKNLVYVLGDVQRPNVYELSEGMNLLQLLTIAGGPILTTGRLQHVILMHEVDDENTLIEVLDVAKMLKSGRNPRIRAGDIVYVPRRRMVKLSEFVNQFTSTVSPLMSLYNQAFDTYYAERRNRLLYGSGGQGVGASIGAP